MSDTSEIFNTPYVSLSDRKPVPPSTVTEGHVVNYYCSSVANLQKDINMTMTNKCPGLGITSTCKTGAEYSQHQYTSTRKKAKRSRLDATTNNLVKTFMAADTRGPGHMYDGVAAAEDGAETSPGVSAAVNGASAPAPAVGAETAPPRPA